VKQSRLKITITKGCVLIALIVGVLSYPTAMPQSATFKQLYGRIQNRSESTSAVASEAAKAACGINNALAAAVSGDEKGFSTRIDETLAALNVAARTIDGELKKPKYDKKINLEKWQYVTDLPLDGVVTQRDLMIRILALVHEAQTAILRIHDGAGTEEDLALAIELTGKISRMLTVFVTTAQ
jgi:hypothetical protein